MAREKDKVFQIRCSERDKAAINALAKIQGKSAAETILDAVYHQLNLAMAKELHTLPEGMTTTDTVTIASVAFINALIDTGYQQAVRPVMQHMFGGDPGTYGLMDQWYKILKGDFEGAEDDLEKMRIEDALAETREKGKAGETKT